MQLLIELLKVSSKRRLVFERYQVDPFFPVVSKVISFFFFGVLLISLISSIAFAQNTGAVAAVLQQVQSGVLSLNEAGDALIKAAEESPDEVTRVAPSINSIPALKEAVAQGLRVNVEQALISRSAHEARGLKALASSVLDQNTADAQIIARLFRLTEYIETGIADGKTAELLTADLGLRSTAEKYIGAQRLGDAAKAYAETVLEQKEPLEALNDLAELQLKWNLTGLEEKAGEAVRRLAKSPGSAGLEQVPWVLERREVQDLVLNAAILEPKVEKWLLELYEARSKAMAAAENPHGVQQALAWVLNRRPDPNSANDELRLDIVLNTGGDRVKPLAESLLKDVRSRVDLGVGMKTRLALKGMLGARLQLMLFVLIFFVLSITVAVLFIKIHYGGFTAEARQEKIKRWAKKRGSGYMRETPLEDEYTRLLSVFGLKDGATEAQIKKAFRDAVKKAHPDAAASGAPVDEKLFQEIKKTHDRIMEIRSSWFGKER